jgi:RND family efflux transporter MFP subunit
VVARLEFRAIAESVWFPGLTSAVHTVTTNAEVAGVVGRIAEEGEEVQSGSVLATLFDPDRETQRREAEQIVIQEKKRVSLAKSQVSAASESFNSGAVSKFELDAYKTQLAITQSTLASAESTLSQAEANIEKSNVVAPYPGFVSARHARVGERVSIGSPLLSITDTSEVEVKVVPPTRYVLGLKGGDSLMVKVNGKKVGAVIKSLVPHTSGTNRSQLTLTFSESELFPANIDVLVKIPTKKLELAAVISRDALIIRQDEIYVFRVRERRAEKIPVEVLLGDGLFVAVKSLSATKALKHGDFLVVRGGETLVADADVDTTLGLIVDPIAR